MSNKEHWERVYLEKDPITDVSWFLAHPTKSMELILGTNLERDKAIIDVGGGASSLVDCLLDAGFRNVSVLDISAKGIQHAQRRLGARSSAVNWIECDIGSFRSEFPIHLWHDRAVFHFLTSAEDRQKYIDALKNALVPGGIMILATFAKDGPSHCSGLPVVRYDAESICVELGPEFQMIHQENQTHCTPWNTEQEFIWFKFQRCPKLLPNCS